MSTSVTRSGNADLQSPDRCWLDKITSKLRFVTAVGQPDQGVTPLYFLRSLPTSAWLRRSILWADDLAAIWPRSGPTPSGRSEEQSWREITYLRSAGLFQPEFIFELSPESMLEALRSVGDGEPVSEAWQDGAPAVGSASTALSIDSELPWYSYSLPGRSPDRNSRRFLYGDKLAMILNDKLERQGLISPSPDGRGYVVASTEALECLLGAGACALHMSSHGRLVPDVAVPAQARRIAAPSPEAETNQALVLAFRGAVVPNLKVDFQRFIDFRLEARNERARRDYIEQLTSLWNLCSNGGSAHMLQEVVRKASTDLRKASESYFKRMDGNTLIAQGLASFAAVIPLAITHPPALILGALSGVGASAVTLAVRKGAPKYLRSASDSGLLAAMGSI